MNTLNPTNDELSQKLANLENRLYDLEHAGQAQLTDYFNLNPSDYTYINSGEIETNEQEIKKWNVGDKVRWKHTTDTFTTVRYGYVWDIDYINLRLKIFGSNFKNIATDPLLYIQRSILNSPNAFPKGIGYSISSITITVPSGTVTPNWFNTRGILTLVGSLAFVSVYIDVTVTGTPSYIETDLPVSAGNTYLTLATDPIEYEEGSNFVNGYADGYLTNTIKYYKETGTFTGSYKWSHNFWYYLDDLSI